MNGGEMTNPAHVRVRDATLADAERVLEIYGYYTEHTAVSFEWKTPSPEVFCARMAEIMRRYPYLVVEADGIVQGYACAHPFVGRAAYDWSCELTIYLDPGARHQGLGAALYRALEERLQRMGIQNLYACIGYPEPEDEYLTLDSARFHARMGFQQAGLFHRCGYKFGRWYHMIWMEKIIGRHESDPAPVRRDEPEAQVIPDSKDEGIS